MEDEWGCVYKKILCAQRLISSLLQEHDERMIYPRFLHVAMRLRVAGQIELEGFSSKPRLDDTEAFYSDAFLHLGEVGLGGDAVAVPAGFA